MATNPGFARITSNALDWIQCSGLDSGITISVHGLGVTVDAVDAAARHAPDSVCSETISFSRPSQQSTVPAVVVKKSTCASSFLNKCAGHIFGEIGKRLYSLQCHLGAHILNCVSYDNVLHVFFLCTLHKLSTTYN